jgi:transposase InsO family protein
VKQQLREATAWGEGPRFLIRDNDDKFGTSFDAVAEGTGIAVLRTPVRAPNANAVCERFLRSVRRECLDYAIVLSEEHLRRILGRYCAYFNGARPRQGIQQRIPNERRDTSPSGQRGSVEEIPILGGLHHEYRLAA